MIQRIQSVWLFLASVAIFALFLFPYLQFFDVAGMGKALYVKGAYRGLEGQAVREEFFIMQTIAAVLLGVFPLYIIFKFHDRKLQIQLVILQLILILLFGFWLYTSASTALTEARQFLSARNIGVGFFLLPISIVFLFMAVGGIRRDEKMVKSADRLR